MTKCPDQELQTIIRDKTTSRSYFKFVADRLIRMVIEEGLNQLPHTKCDVTTPTGCTYSGLRYVVVVVVNRYVLHAWSMVINYFYFCVV